MPSREGPAVREESHLDDMRDAIRGDFERLAARRGEQELMRVDEPDPRVGVPSGPLAERPEAQEEPVAEPEIEPESELEPAPPRRSWLARMLST
jgi:hypothetical protein